MQSDYINNCAKNLELLTKSMCGMRDAAMIGSEIADLLVGSIEFLQGRGSPCNFDTKSLQLRVSVDGDDFTVLGLCLSSSVYSSGLIQRWTINQLGILGLLEVDRTTQEISIDWFHGAEKVSRGKLTRDMLIL